MKQWLITLLITIITIFSVACDDDSVDPKDETKTGWVVGDINSGYGTILFTNDGGMTWSRQGDSSAMADISFVAVKAYDDNNAFALGNDMDGNPSFFKTTDAGQTWLKVADSQILPETELSGMHIAGLNEYWLVGFNRTILYTQDAGNSWTKIQVDLPYDYQFAAIAKKNNKIWVCGNQPNYGGVIVHSTDNGQTWAMQGDTTFLLGHGMIDISAASDTHLWMVGHQRTIMNTTDGGNTWNVQKTQDGIGLDANGCCAVNEEVCWDVEDMGVVYYTSDKGQNWTKQEVPAISSAFFLYRVSAISVNEAWVVGPSQMPPQDGIILYTSNAGQLWTRQTTNYNVWLADVSFVGSNH